MTPVISTSLSGFHPVLLQPFNSLTTRRDENTFYLLNNLKKVFVCIKADCRTSYVLFRDGYIDVWKWEKGRHTMGGSVSSCRVNSHDAALVAAAVLRRHVPYCKWKQVAAAGFISKTTPASMCWHKCFNLLVSWICGLCKSGLGQLWRFRSLFTAEGRRVTVTVANDPLCLIIIASEQEDVGVKHMLFYKCTTSRPWTYLVSYGLMREQATSGRATACQPFVCENSG